MLPLREVRTLFQYHWPWGKTEYDLINKFRPRDAQKMPPAKVASRQAAPAEARLAQSLAKKPGRERALSSSVDHLPGPTPPCFARNSVRYILTMSTCQALLGKAFITISTLVF